MEPSMMQSLSAEQELGPQYQTTLRGPQRPGTLNPERIHRRIQKVSIGNTYLNPNRHTKAFQATQTEYHTKVRKRVTEVDAYNISRGGQGVSNPCDQLGFHVEDMRHGAKENATLERDI